MNPAHQKVARAITILNRVSDRSVSAYVPNVVDAGRVPSFQAGLNRSLKRDTRIERSVSMDRRLHPFFWKKADQHPDMKKNLMELRDRFSRTQDPKSIKDRYQRITALITQNDIMRLYRMTMMDIEKAGRS